MISTNVIEPFLYNYLLKLLIWLIVAAWVQTHSDEKIRFIAATGLTKEHYLIPLNWVLNLISNILTILFSSV